MTSLASAESGVLVARRADLSDIVAGALDAMDNLLTYSKSIETRLMALRRHL